jgi:hypothetical protein
MLRLDLTSEPRWLDLGRGVRLRLASLTTALMAAARADLAAEALPETATPEALALAMAKALARRAVLEWEGVGDAAGGPLPLSPEGVDALLDVWPVFEAFQTGYVAMGLILEAKKNASAPSPSGASAGATPTARPVRKAARTAWRG